MFARNIAVFISMLIVEFQISEYLTQKTNDIDLKWESYPFIGLKTS